MSLFPVFLASEKKQIFNVSIETCPPPFFPLSGKKKPECQLPSIPRGKQFVPKLSVIVALSQRAQNIERWKRAKIPSVTDASAPRFHQCSPNYKYQQLLSFMAVQDKFGLCFGQKIEA